MRKLMTLIFIALAVLLTRPVAVAGERSMNDPFVAKQWNLDRIDAFDAWKEATGKGAVIAIVDSGIDLSHSDLKANVLRKGKDYIDDGKPQGRARTRYARRRDRSCSDEQR